MEYTQAEVFEQYIRDLRVVRSISRPSFPEGKAPAAVLEEIQTNALRCNTLMRQNEALLAQLVYDRDPASFMAASFCLACPSARHLTLRARRRSGRARGVGEASRSCNVRLESVCSDRGRN